MLASVAGGLFGASGARKRGRAIKKAYKGAESATRELGANEQRLTDYEIEQLLAMADEQTGATGEAITRAGAGRTGELARLRGVAGTGIASAVSGVRDRLPPAFQGYAAQPEAASVPTGRGTLPGAYSRYTLNAQRQAEADRSLRRNLTTELVARRGLSEYDARTTGGLRMALTGLARRRGELGRTTALERGGMDVREAGDAIDLQTALRNAGDVGAGRELAGGLLSSLAPLGTALATGG
jgi:hypothetical protein